MADESECTPAGTRKRPFVALAENVEDAEGTNSSVVIGNRVSEAAVRRSGLLDGIDITEGLASLPSNIAPADVKLWEAAYLINMTPALPELIAVLKVCSSICSLGNQSSLQ